MATTNGVTEQPNTQPQTQPPGDRRDQVMLGELPNDFLRTQHPTTQEQEDERIAHILQAQQQAGVNVYTTSNVMRRLSVSVVQARLTKNYGLTKMDPYCRVRIGHTVFESPTAYNGAKNPTWNKTVTTYLPHGVDSMYIEVFDERPFCPFHQEDSTECLCRLFGFVNEGSLYCLLSGNGSIIERSFTMDDRIAWAHIKIPETVIQGETYDEWYPLSGRQGDDKEGSLNLVLSLTNPVESNVYAPNVYTYQTPVPVMLPSAMPGMPVVLPQVQGYPQQMPPPQPRGPLYTEEDLKMVQDMFPNMEEEVIKSVIEANRGNKDAAINSLLSMSAE